MADPVPSDSLRAFWEAATQRYSQALPGSPAERYLAARGIEPETMTRFRLGYVAEPMPGHQHLQGRLAIPYLAPDGSAVTMRFRRLDGGQERKYLGMAGEPPRLFNVASLHIPVTGMFICEGELDTITVAQLNYPVVGVPGATSWNPIWRRLFVQYTVHVLHDADDAGRKLAETICNELDNARAIQVNPDVNQYLIDHGKEALVEKITGRRPN